MIYREFARTGFRCSAVGMGTYYDFRWIASARLLGRRPREDAIVRSIRTGLDSGLNLIDTAELYGSEPLVSKALEGRDRESVFIATKVSPTHLRREKLIRACERSLRRLNTGYIDLYQLHFPAIRVPLSETMGAMEELVDRGMIRYIGISNFSFERMKEAEQALRKYPLTSTQMHYNMSYRKVEEQILPYCEKNGMALLPYYPVGHGRLASGGSHSPALAADLCRKYGLKSKAQLALTYLVSRSNCTFPIPRARTPEHVAENSEIDALLDPNDLTALASAYPER